MVLSAASTGWSFMGAVSLHLSFNVYSAVSFIVLKDCLRSTVTVFCKTDRQTDRQMDGRTEGRAGGRAGRRTGGRTGRQADRQIDRHQREKWSSMPQRNDVVGVPQISSPLSWSTSVGGTLKLNTVKSSSKVAKCDRQCSGRI